MPIDDVLGVGDMVLVHIAHPDDMRVGLTEEGLHIGGSLAAHPDAAHDDSIAGRDLPASSQGGRRDDMEQSYSGAHADGAFEKAATVDSSVFRHLCYLLCLRLAHAVHLPHAVRRHRVK